MTALFVLNDAPYASERDYNALRLATSLAAEAEGTVNVFLIGEGVRAGVTAEVPDGAHDIAWMLRRLAASGACILACRTCMEARGMVPASLIEDVRQGTLDQLAAWTAQAEKILVF